MTQATMIYIWSQFVGHLSSLLSWLICIISDYGKSKNEELNQPKSVCVWLILQWFVCKCLSHSFNVWCDEIFPSFELQLWPAVSFFAMMKILAKSFVFSPKFSPLQTAAGHEWWIEEWDEETIDFSHDERWTRGEFSPTCQLFAVAAHTLSRLFLSHRFVRFARSCCLLLLLLQESFAFLQLYTHDDDFDADDTHIHGDYHCR